MHPLPLIKRRGLMFVLSSPSGAGKTTLARRLLENDPALKLSVSMTTRKRRPGEVSTHHYHFVSQQQFNDAIANGDFLEWAKVFDYYYGTPKKPVEKALEEGMDVLFDIDWQGTQQLGQIARGDLVSVFILPPNWGELERRLVVRAQDSPEIVNKRMSKAIEEMSHWPEYDYVIVNEDLDKAVHQVESILRAERLKRQRQIGLTDFVKKLIQRVPHF